MICERIADVKRTFFGKTGKEDHVCAAHGTDKRARVGIRFVYSLSGRYSETGIIYGVGTAFPCTAPVGLVPYFIIAYSAAEMDDKRTHICYPCVEGFIREERRASDSSVCLGGSLVVYLVSVNYVHPRYHAVGA